MSNGIRKAAVLGAGVMGSGIAAHLASCGIRTLLLDIVPFDLSDEEREDKKARNRLAQKGLDDALKSKPNVFVHKGAAAMIDVGNFDDDLHRLAECDWVVEVVIENMKIKQSLLEKVEAAVGPETLVTSNTSGLSISGMVDGRSDDFKRRFFGTHFFNPVRYMHLLEVIPGPDTDPTSITRVADFMRKQLGKGIVYAKDTPNFIANRIGVYAMMSTIHTMAELDYTIEEVDAIVGRPMGRPKSAAFRTADVVGLDTFAHVSQNCYDNLPDDPERDIFQLPSFLTDMVERKWLGSKTGGGFYRKEGKVIQALDLKTMTYRDKVKPALEGLKVAKGTKGSAAVKLRTLIQHEGRAGRFAWHVLSRILAYSANIADDIADDIVNIDRAMRWGFNWDQGPFETWQALGITETTERMRADGLSVPSWVDDAIEKGGFYQLENDPQSFFAQTRGQTPIPAIPGRLDLAAHKRSNGVVERNRGASLIDIGDGIACLEYHTKMNTLDQDLGAMLLRATELAEERFDGLVIANEATHFSAGANLMMILMMANQKKWDDISTLVKGVQDTVQAVKYCGVPVVSCPHGLTLGGGAEMAMGADRMMVDQETYMGLVEVGVGLIPGGGGTLNLLKRLFDNVPADADPNSYDRLPIVQRVFENIAMAKVATGGGEVFSLGFGTSKDELAINRDTRIADGKRLARYMADRGYTPPRPADNLVLPGTSGKAALSLAVYGMKLSGYVSEHDEKIAGHLAHVLCGGDTDGKRAVSEEHVLDLEREAFMSLVGETKTIERMQHMLTKNKPLRN